MNFDFSDDQKFLKKEVRKFLEKNCPTGVVRTVLDDPAKAHHEVLWRQVADQGWIAAAVPEAYGGLGLSHLELCVIADELGRALAPIPFASTVYFFAEALMLAGDEAQKSALLPRVAAGELIGAFATSEAPGPLIDSALTSTVSADRLSGEKLPVTDGGIADVCVVLANENGRPGLFLTRLDAEGVTRSPLDTLDPSRGAARLEFKDTPVERLGPPGAGMALMQRVLDRAAVLLAFEQCGGADKALEMATAYAKARYAFGRPIGSYQAIKHKLADMFIKCEIARSSAYYGAWALSADARELPVAASAARIAASDAYWFAAKECIQTHGGIGFTWEVDCHLHYRRARQLGLVASPPRIWKERLIRELESLSAA